MVYILGPEIYEFVKSKPSVEICVNDSFVAGINDVILGIHAM